MALTKKQKTELEERYQSYYRSIEKDIFPADIMQDAKTSFRELRDVMKIVGYKNEDFITLNNGVMEQYDIGLFLKYLEMNETMNEIEGREILFTYEYTPKQIYKKIDGYDYDRRYGALANKMHEIRQYLKTGEKIRTGIEKQVARMIA